MTDVKRHERRIRDDVVAVLTKIAPEVEDDELQDDEPLRDQVDLDSMDWLNFLIGVHHRFDVEIPESHYAKLTTVADIVHYVEGHRPGS